MVMIGSVAFGFGDVSAVWYFLGGVIVGTAISIFIDPAIILLSALIGTGVIVNGMTAALTISSGMGIFFFLVLSVVGVLVQMNLMDDHPDADKSS